MKRREFITAWRRGDMAARARAPAGVGAGDQFAQRHGPGSDASSTVSGEVSMKPALSRAATSTIEYRWAEGQ